MAELSGCDYVMIGRGALGNPWIFDMKDNKTKSDAPSARERADMFLRHARLTVEDKGEHIAVLEMRKHAGWYFKGMSGSAKLRASVNKITTIGRLISEIEEFIQAR
jgi:tRNA-dihydrouridine synthase B